MSRTSCWGLSFGRCLSSTPGRSPTAATSSRSMTPVVRSRPLTGTVDVQVEGSLGLLVKHPKGPCWRSTLRTRTRSRHRRTGPNSVGHCPARACLAATRRSSASQPMSAAQSVRSSTAGSLGATPRCPSHSRRSFSFASPGRRQDVTSLEAPFYFFPGEIRSKASSTAPS